MILVCSQKRWTHRGLKKGGVMVPHFTKGKETVRNKMVKAFWVCVSYRGRLAGAAASACRCRKRESKEHRVRWGAAMPSGEQPREGSRELWLRDFVTQGAGSNNWSRNVYLSGLLWRLNGQYLHSTGNGNGKCELFLLCYALLVFCDLGGD